MCVSAFHAQQGTCVSHLPEKETQAWRWGPGPGPGRWWTWGSLAPQPRQACLGHRPDGEKGLAALAQAVCRRSGQTWPAHCPEGSAQAVCSPARDLGALGGGRVCSSGLPRHTPPTPLRGHGVRGLSVCVALVPGIKR